MALLSKVSFILKFVIIAVIYIIIIVALRIMYKDVKNGGKKKVTKRKAVGLEILDKGENNNLRAGGVIPIHQELTIGRREDNLLVLEDKYVSSRHVRIYLKNTDYILEDLGSTNGTLLNGRNVKEEAILKNGDVIKIGTSTFKVIR